MIKATAIQHVDNEHVTVTEWRFSPGAATGWHRHGYDYVITPVTGGPFKVVDGDGNETSVMMEPGKSYFRAFGVEHDVISTGESEQSFVEIELKARAG